MKWKDRVVRREVLWRLLDRTFVHPAQSLQQRRKRYEYLRRRHRWEEVCRTVLPQVIPDLTVRHGPFHGMRYPQLLAPGRDMFSKLLGTYESELHGVIEEICGEQYSQIIDIGCADGYYATGFAMRVSSATVHAFDIDPEARELTVRMAKVNGVDSRVVVGEGLSSEDLAQFDLHGRTLILSDCEGFESELFTPEVVGKLANSDVLIETHDFLDRSISDQLRADFQLSHVVRVILSVPDEVKASECDCEELASLDPEVRLLAVSEFRPASMRWLYMVPRSQKRLEIRAGD